LRLEFFNTDAERALLNKVTSAGSWGRPMAPRTAQGLGFHADESSMGSPRSLDRSTERTVRGVGLKITFSS
jgi:hypothetical protein